MSSCSGYKGNTNEEMSFHWANRPGLTITPINPSVSSKPGSISFPVGVVRMPSNLSDKELYKMALEKASVCKSPRVKALSRGRRKFVEPVCHGLLSDGEEALTLSSDEEAFAHEPRTYLKKSEDWNKFAHSSKLGPAYQDENDAGCDDNDPEFPGALFNRPGLTISPIRPVSSTPASISFPVGVVRMPWNDAGGDDDDPEFPGVTDIPCIRSPVVSGSEEDEYKEGVINGIKADQEGMEEDESEVKEKEEEEEEDVPPQEHMKGPLENIPVNDTSIFLRCRSIRIGSFKVYPKPNTLTFTVYLSMDGISFSAPKVSDSTKIITFLLKPCDVTQMLVHFGKCFPVMFIFTTTKFADALRRSLNMSEDIFGYYDPTSSDEKEKRITFLIEKFNEEHRQFIRRFLTDREVREIDEKTANEILVKSTPNQSVPSANAKSSATTPNYYAAPDSSPFSPFGENNSKSKILENKDTSPNGSPQRNLKTESHRSRSKSRSRDRSICRSGARSHSRGRRMKSTARDRHRSRSRDRHYERDRRQNSRSRGKRSHSRDSRRKSGSLSRDSCRQSRSQSRDCRSQETKRRSRSCSTETKKKSTSRSRDYRSLERRSQHRSSSRDRYRKKHYSRSLNRSQDRSKGRSGSVYRKPGSLSLPSGGVTTPQMTLQQTMAAVNAKAQALTGIALPKYYNPAALNLLKYADQVQKSKLLWQNKEKVEQADACNVGKASVDVIKKKKVLAIPVQGIEFMKPLDGFFCHLCKTFEASANDHLKSHTHLVNWKNLQHNLEIVNKMMSSFQKISESRKEFWKIISQQLEKSKKECQKASTLATGQVFDLSDKLEQSEEKVDCCGLVLGMDPAEEKKNEDKLGKATKDSSKLTSEEIPDPK